MSAATRSSQQSNRVLARLELDDRGGDRRPARQRSLDLRDRGDRVGAAGVGEKQRDRALARPEGGRVRRCLTGGVRDPGDGLVDACVDLPDCDDCEPQPATVPPRLRDTLPERVDERRACRKPGCRIDRGGGTLGRGGRRGKESGGLGLSLEIGREPLDRGREPLERNDPTSCHRL